MELALFYLFGVAACGSGVMVIISKNPIHSVLFLILVFLNGTGLLVLLQVEFLAMLFLIVYVGAIAILFLFVVMMLNIKQLDETISRYIPVGAFIGFFLLVESVLLTSSEFGSLTQVGSFQDWEETLVALSNIQVLGHLLYTRYSVLFLLSGMILLLAMVGAIVLTLHKRSVVSKEEL